jgi:hypothetical protein
MSTSTYDTDDDGTVNAADTALALVGIEAPTPVAGDDQKYLKYVHATTEYVLDTPSGSGDMTKAVYDPTAINASAFDYGNFINTPTLGTAAAQDVGYFATAAQGSTADTAVQPGGLATVATSGSYSDLSNKPTIPTLPVKASGAELDTGTDDAKFATAKALKDSHNVPSVAPSTSGNVLTSNGTDWTSSVPVPATLTLSAFTTDHNWTTTDAVVVTIAESAGLFGLLYLHSTGYKKAKADAVATLPCVALQCTAGTGAQTVIKRGYARDASWTWTKGLPLWVSAATAGVMTQTQPGSGKWVQFVGYAEETNVIYFNPSPVWVEVP